jgi:hypothetical protein
VETVIDTIKNSLKTMKERGNNMIGRIRIIWSRSFLISLTILWWIIFSPLDRIPAYINDFKGS